MELLILDSFHIDELLFKDFNFINFCTSYFSFHPKVKFYIYYKSIFRATLSVSSVYILWDIIFTKLGIWGFNNQYLNGIYILNLPIEEILFFLCIPFCCLYTYHLVEKFNISFFKNY